MENENSKYGPTILRVFLGLLFIIPGFSKLMNPGMITGMLGQLGFPIAGFFAWLLLLSEIVFGAALLLGYKVKYAVWPLALVLVIATVTVHLPSMAQNPMGVVNVLFHLAAIAGLVNLFLVGPGALGVGKE